MDVGVETGGCLCGAVRYRVTGRPSRSGLCHCRSCRKAASAPVLPFATFPVAAFALQQGEPVLCASSPGVERGFCGRCGSPLTYRNSADPAALDIMTASLDNPEAFPPTLHVWLADAIAWDKPGDGLPGYSRSAPADETAT